MNYEDYGLVAVDASGSDHDKGIVQAPDGSFYQIEGFKHGQKDGLDQDKGATFSSSLQEDAAAMGHNPSNFNTAGDVEGALAALGEQQAEPVVEGPAWDDAKNGKELSDDMAAAKERAQAWIDSGYGGEVYGTGQGASVQDFDLGKDDPYKKAAQADKKKQSIK